MEVAAAAGVGTNTVHRFCRGQYQGLKLVTLCRVALFRVAGAGDVNGDGYADVIVGAPFYDADGGATDCDVSDIFVLQRFVGGQSVTVENACAAYGP